MLGSRSIGFHPAVVWRYAPFPFSSSSALCRARDGETAVTLLMLRIMTPKTRENRHHMMSDDVYNPSEHVQMVISGHVMGVYLLLSRSFQPLGLLEAVICRHIHYLALPCAVYRRLSTYTVLIYTSAPSMSHSSLPEAR